MEYIILALILLGAVYLLIRSVRGKPVHGDRPDSCDRCTRVARPPAEKMYQIELPPENEKT